MCLGADHLELDNISGNSFLEKNWFSLSQQPISGEGGICPSTVACHLELPLCRSCLDDHIQLPCHVQNTLPSSRCLVLWLLKSFCPSLLQFPPSLRSRAHCVDVWVGAGDPLLTYSLHFGQLWISAVATICCKVKLLWQSFYFSN